MDEKTKQAVIRFIQYSNAKRLVHIIDSLVHGAGISVQEVCSWMEYDIMSYVEACELIEQEKEWFSAFYEMMLKEQQIGKNDAYHECRTENIEDYEFQDGE